MWECGGRKRIKCFHPSTPPPPIPNTTLEKMCWFTSRTMQTVVLTIGTLTESTILLRLYDICAEWLETWLLKLRKSRSTFERSPSLVGSCACTRYFCSALAALVRPVKIIFFPTEHYSTLFVSLPSKLGRRSCRVACLLIHVSVYVKANRYRRVVKSTSKYDIMTNFLNYPWWNS